jgi:hypothetical protein
MHRISILIGASPIDTTIEKSKFGQSRHTVFDIARPKRKARFLAGLLKNETTEESIYSGASAVHASHLSTGFVDNKKPAGRTMRALGGISTMAKW